jgi:hypothetical protein
MRNSTYHILLTLSTDIFKIFQHGVMTPNASHFSNLLQMKLRWTKRGEAWTKRVDRLKRPGSGVQDASQIGWTKPGGVGSGEIRRYRPETA